MHGGILCSHACHWCFELNRSHVWILQLLPTSPPPHGKTWLWVQSCLQLITSKPVQTRSCTSGLEKQFLWFYSSPFPVIGDISLRADADKKPVFGLIRTAIEFQDKKWQLSNGFCFLYSTTETNLLCEVGFSTQIKPWFPSLRVNLIT